MQYDNRRPVMHIYNYFQILFGLSEAGLFIFKRSKTVAQKSNTDKRSLLFLWITIPAVLTFSGFITHYKIGPTLDSIVLQDIGLTVIVIGFIIRWIAVVQLGRLFTVDVAISATHTLKTEGLYKIVRHPSYLGLMLIITGLAVCMPSLVWMAVTIIAVFIAMNYRIIVEEEALTNEFGDQYRDYSEKVSKLIPWLY